MGNGYTLECKSCKRKYRLHLGIGFGYEFNYYEQLKEAIIDERCPNLPYAKSEIKIDGGKTTYKCPNCGFWKVEDALDLFINHKPKDEEDFFAAFENYNREIVFEYEHICPNCKSLMQKTKDYSNLKCKSCNGALEIVGMMYWD